MPMCGASSAKNRSASSSVGVPGPTSPAVRDDEASVVGLDHVELDEVDARFDRDAERVQCVLGSECRRTSVSDA